LHDNESYVRTECDRISAEWHAHLNQVLTAAYAADSDDDAGHG